MVDCGSPRCAHERRSFRRDLQTWSKKLPLVLGLERIAADYVDNNTAQLLLNPYPDWEQHMCNDFIPSKKCFHCERKLPNIYKRISRIIEEAKRGKESSGRICLRSLQDLMPFCLDFYTHGFGRELFSEVVKTYFLTALHQPEQKQESQPYPAAIPLSHSNGDIFSKLKVPHLLAMNTKNSRKPENSKEEYTIEVLNDAISEIPERNMRSHQALLSYGVAQANLSNTFVKEDPDEIVIEEDTEETKIPLQRRDADLYDYPLVPHLTSLKYSDMSMGMLNLEEMPILSTNPHPFMPYPVSIKLDSDVHNQMTEQRLSQIRRMHNLNGLNKMRPCPSHSNHLRLPMLVDVVRKLVQQKVAEIKQNFGRSNQNEDALNESRREEGLFSPLLPYFPFSPFLTHKPNEESLTAPMYKHIMESIYVNMLREENPMPKPFGKVNESSRIGDTLKDIIAKTISEKIKLRNVSSDENSLPSSPDGIKPCTHRSDRNMYRRNSSPNLLNKDVKMSASGCSPPKRMKKDISKSGTNSVSKSDSIDTCSSTTKKTRPKRGQYRKYNSQLLMDAVKAVQRGEMSVHRAGSFFGVPHSTLEYKVKERHLLRQKKAQSPPSSSKCDTDSTLTCQSGTPSPPVSKDTSSSSKKQNDMHVRPSTSSSSSLCFSFSSPKKTVMKTPTSLPSLPSSSHTPPPSLSALNLPASKEKANMSWFHPYLTSATPLDSEMNFTPPSISMNNSASELLRKLQHKVQSKEASFPKENNFDLPLMRNQVFDIAQPTSSVMAISERRVLYNQPV